MNCLSGISFRVYQKPLKKLGPQCLTLKAQEDGQTNVIKVRPGVTEASKTPRKTDYH